MHEPIVDVVPADPLEGAPPAPIVTSARRDESARSPEPIGDGQFRKLDPRFIQVEQIETWIFEAIVAGLLVIGLIVSWAAGWAPWWGQALLLVAAVGFVGLLHWMLRPLPVWGYEATSYAVSDLLIEIRKGIWWKHVIDVPRSRIQHMDVSQGPLARAYGIAKLTLYTAGTEYASIELDGLAHETALRIRDFLIRKGDGGSDVV